MRINVSSVNYFDKLAPTRPTWKRRNNFYHKLLEKYYSFYIPPGSKVLEIGCGTGELLNHVKPREGLGIDFSENMIQIARQKFPNLNFLVDDIENLHISETYDYIIVSDLLASLWDVQKAMAALKKVCHKNTRIVISSYNIVWEPLLKLSEFLGLKAKQPIQNWLSMNDIKNLLLLEGFEVIKKERKILLPKYIPVVSLICNRFFANLPFLNKLDLVNFVIARPVELDTNEYSVSIIVPARNEKGNIENAILRIPKFGKSIEYIFVEGNSNDHTWDEILRIKGKYKDLNIVALKQSGKGKGNAVRNGFDAATGDILMILDADLTTPPEELPKFYSALSTNKGEFINGCRLVYPLEKQAMRLLNIMANQFFGVFLSFILGQRLKDTLCGTKVLFRKDYENIKINREYFGDFDPFGDFDLLFGATKQNLKIVEIIVRYKDRQYGSTQIHRIRHGLLLLKMSLFAAVKIKFI